MIRRVTRRPWDQSLCICVTLKRIDSKGEVDGSVEFPQRKLGESSSTAHKHWFQK